MERPLCTIANVHHRPFVMSSYGMGGQPAIATGVRVIGQVLIYCTIDHAAKATGIAGTSPHTEAEPGGVEKVRKQLMEIDVTKLQSVHATPLHSAVESCVTDNVRNLLKGTKTELQTSSQTPT